MSDAKVGFAVLAEEWEDMWAGFSWSQLNPLTWTVQDALHPKNIKYVALAVLAVGWSLIILMIYQLSKDPSPAQRLRERQRVVKQMHKRDATAAKSQTDKKNE